MRADAGRGRRDVVVRVARRGGLATRTVAAVARLRRCDLDEPVDVELGVRDLSLREVTRVHRLVAQAAVRLLRVRRRRWVAVAGATRLLGTVHLRPDRLRDRSAGAGDDHVVCGIDLVKRVAVAVAVRAGRGVVIPAQADTEARGGQLGGERIFLQRAVRARDEDVAEIADLLRDLVTGLAGEPLVPVRRGEVSLVRADADRGQVRAARGVARRRDAVAFAVTRSGAPVRRAGHVRSHRTVIDDMTPEIARGNEGHEHYGQPETARSHR